MEALPKAPGSVSEQSKDEVKWKEYFYLLRDLEKYMYEFDSLENVIQRCQNINCIGQSLESSTPKIFHSETQQPFQDMNLVILACKFGLIDVLQYILSDEENVLYNVSERIGRNAIQADDCDSAGHNAFYYAMQSHHTELLKTLVEKWPAQNLVKNPDLLDEILSAAYNEIKLRNVPVSDQMSVYIETILVELRFFNKREIETGVKKPNQGKNKGQKKRIFNPEPVLQRVNFVLEKIEFISSKMATEEHTFICTLKQIVKCVHVLKRQLRPTYDRIPWEEVEFLFVAFLTASEKQNEIKMLHGSVLSRKKVLGILKNLKECLLTVKKNMPQFQGSFLFPKMKRPEMIAQIISTTSFTKEFYDNFEQLRDFFTMETINQCLSLASSANARDPHGQLVITRCLQVVGEHLKDTIESPKLSLSTGELLLSALSVATSEVLKKLRDSLSHDDSLKVRMDIEENADYFFLQIQKDLKNLVATVSLIVYEKKISLILKLLDSIMECQSVEEMKEMLGTSDVATMEADFEQGYSIGAVEKLESLLLKLFKEMRDLTKEEATLFAKIHSTIQSEKMKLKTVQQDFVKGYAFLSITMQMVVSGGEVSGIKGYANHAHIFLTRPKDTTNLKLVLNPCKELFKNAFSRVKEEGDIKIRILNDILHVLQYEVDNTKWIQELRSQLTKDHAPIKKKKVVKPSNQYSDVLQKKVRMLHEVLNSNRLNNNRLHESITRYHRNQTLKALVEMLLLDIMSILQSNSRLSENPYFLDHDYPVLLGQNLRKHLAHENPIVRVLTNVNLDVLLTANAVANGIIEGCENETDKVLKNDPLLVKSKCDKDLKHLEVQQRLFDSLMIGDIASAKNCLKEGADIKGRDPSLQTALHFAAMASDTETIQLVVAEYGLDINSTDIQGRNALHVSSEFGRVTTVKFLVEELRVNVNCVDNNERTPLLLAAGNGHLNVVEALLLKEADTSLRDNSGSTPLQKSVENNLLNVLKVLLKDESDVDDGYGEFTPLHVAAQKGYVDIAYYLLSWGANVKKRTDEGLTALHSAALGGHWEVAELLISKGAEVNARGVRNETSLLYAAQNGHQAVVRVLIDHGAELDPSEKMTLATPLHTAAGYGHLEVVNLLIRKGANIDARRFYGETALHQSIMHQHFKVAEFLIENGASLNIQDSEDLTPLHISATAGHEGILRSLIHKGAEVNIKNKEQFTALHIAAMYGHKNIAEILLENGAEVDAKDDTHSTPLHVCAHSGCSAVGEVLVKHRGNVNAVNSMGISPAMAAASRGDAEIFKLLVSNGAKVDSHVLSLACFSGNTETVQYLIEDRGSDVNGDHNGKTPLHEAVKGNRKQVVEMLIKKGADVTAKNEEGDSPLMSAVKLNFKDIVSILVPTSDEVDFDMLRVALFFGADMLNILLQKSKFDFNGPNSQHAAAVLLHTAVVTGQKSVTKIILEKGVSVNACINGGMMPLFTAATAGHSDVVTYLLSENASVNFLREDGATPLHPASLYGFGKIVEALLKAGADAQIRDSENRTAVEMAVLNDHLQVVQMLLDHLQVVQKMLKTAVVNSVGHRGLTLLHVASERGRLNMVKFLVSCNADAHSCNSAGSKPIHLSAMQGQTEVVEFFLSSGLNVIDESSSSGETPLHYAIYGRNLQMVRYLVDKGADVNITDTLGSSPAHVAASIGQVEILHFLLERGSRYDGKNVRNMTPLQIASAYGRQDIVQLLSRIDELFEAVKRHDIQKVKLLVENGAIVNAKNEYLASALHLAALNGYADISELLLHNQANPDAIDFNEYMPLHFASFYSHLEVAISLLKKGATYNALTKNRKSPLELSPQQSPVSSLLEFIERFFKAVQNGDCEILEELEGLPLDVLKAVFKTQNTDKKTLLAVAIRNDFPRIKSLKRVYENAFKDFLPMDKNGDLKLEDFFIAVTQKKSGEFGLDNPSALDMREDIALMFFRRQMFKESLGELQSIFLKRVETVGMGMDQLLTLRNIALVLFNQGDYQKAIEIFRKVFKKLKVILGENNTEVMETLSTMSMALDSVGEFDEALTFNLEILETLRENKEAQFPLYFKVMKNTGIVLMHLKRYYDALEIFQTVFKEGESHSFIDNPDVFQMLHHVGTAFYELGNYKEALVLFSKTLEKQKNYLGLNHLDTLRTYKSIGLLFLTRGQLFNAYKVFKIIIGPMAIILGPNNPEINFIVQKLRFIEIQVDIKDNKSCNNLKSFFSNKFEEN